MVKIFQIIATIILLIVTYACNNDDVSIEERDRLLTKAFNQLDSNDDQVVINALETIGSYPTHLGLIEVVNVWEKNKSLEVEKQALNTLSEFEVFREDNILIKDIFYRNYDENITDERRQKLISLL